MLRINRRKMMRKGRLHCATYRQTQHFSTCSNKAFPRVARLDMSNASSSESGKDSRVINAQFTQTPDVKLV